MPKRKGDDNCDRIKRKIRKLEKKLQRKQRRRNRSHSVESKSSLTSQASQSPLDRQDNAVMEYFKLSDDEETILGVDLSSSLPPPDENLDEPAPSTSGTGNVTSVHSEMIAVPKPVDPGPPTATEPLPPADPAPPATEDLSLDKDLLEILGMDPTTDKKYGKDIHKDLAIRFQHWTTTGITKELRKEFKDKYITPGNCKLIDPPALNAEIKAAVSELMVKRDKAIEGKQKHLTSAITCLGEAITLLLSSKEKNTALIKLLMDSARIICDCQHADTTTRRNFLLGVVKKEVREQLQNTKIDKLLFGENLADTIKSAKAINKSGTDLKQSAPKIPNKKQIPHTSNSSKHLNWKNPGPVRRLTGPPRMKEPVATSTRSRPTISSKQSQHPQQRPNYNRR